MARAKGRFGPAIELVKRPISFALVNVATLWHRTAGRARLLRKLAGLRLGPGPALVLGSAPSATAPEGLGPDWSLVSVNGSQKRAEDWGLARPTLTVFRSSVTRDDWHQNDLWRELAGRGTDQAVSLGTEARRKGLLAGFQRRSYDVGTLTILTQAEKAALVDLVTGAWTAGGGNVRVPSQGLFAAVLAVQLGAPAVVLSGFSFTAVGHYYPTSGPLKRDHVAGDQSVVAGFKARGLPVYAADGAFAASTGLRPWTGRPE